MVRNFSVVALRSADDYFFALKAGRESGFNHYFDEYYKQLVHFAVRFVKEQEVAKDIVEDSFVTLYEKRETLQISAAVKSFLYTTVHNRCLSHLNHNRIKRRVHSEIAYSSDPIDTKSVVHEMIRTEAMGEIFRVIDQLPEKIKQVFILHYFEGKKLREIANEMGRAESTVKSWKQKGLQTIRKKLPHLSYATLLLYLSFFGTK